MKNTNIIFVLEIELWNFSTTITDMGIKLYIDNLFFMVKTQPRFTY